MKLLRERNGNGTESLTKKIKKDGKSEKYMGKFVEQLKEWGEERNELDEFGQKSEKKLSRTQSYSDSTD